MVVAMTAIVLGSWHTAPSLRSARAAHAVVVADGAMYALGGTGGGGAPTGVEGSDARAWKVVTHLPHGGINAPAAVTLNHRIYVIGRFTHQTNLPTDAVETYDPATSGWADA